MTGAKVQKLTPRYWYKSAKTDAEGDAVGKTQDDRQVFGRLQLNIFDLHNLIAAKQAERMTLLEFKVKFDEKGTQSTCCTITSTKVKKLTQSEIRRKRYSAYLLYEYKDAKTDAMWKFDEADISLNLSKAQEASIESAAAAGEALRFWLWSLKDAIYEPYATIRSGVDITSAAAAFTLLRPHSLQDSLAYYCVCVLILILA